MIRALKYPMYSLAVDNPTQEQNRLPGNIGEGIKADARVNRRKNTSSVSVPLKILATCEF